MHSQLGHFLAPRSIAVIGASNEPTKRGYQAIRRLLADGFPGPIYPVNPRQSEILGLQAYPSVGAVEDDIDLALVCTPARTLPGLLAECGAKGITGAVVLGNGFGESGDEAGLEIGRQTLEAAHRHGVRIVGPNTNGVFNLNRRMNLVGVEGAEPGHIGIVSQSGNMMLALVAEAKRQGHVGFSTYIGVGNQLDIRFNEYLEFFGTDEDTRVPFFYVEGFRNGRRFLEVAREVTAKKPVVVYKSGRTEAGQRSASSHTGSLAGSFQLTRDVLRQAAVTVIERSDTILPVTEALAKSPVPAGNRVAVLGDSGGHGTITADAIAESSLVAAELSDATTEALRALLPASASLVVPVDVAGGTDDKPSLFADCARVLLEDDGVDMLIIVGMFGGYGARFAEHLTGEEVETSIKVGALTRRFGKPILVQSVYAPRMPPPLVTLRDAGVPLFVFPETVVRSAEELARYGASRRRMAAYPPLLAGGVPEPAAAIIATATADGRASLYEHEAKALLAAHGVTVPVQRLIRTPDDIAGVAAEFGAAPLALKVVSAQILHKSDAGGVRLNVVGETALRAAYDDILASARGYDAGAVIEGVLATPMARPGVEIIVGMVTDPIFGPVLMFGLGGIFVEVLKDVVFRAIPMSSADAGEMLEQIASSRILDGVRGAPPVDRGALVDLMMRVQALVQAHPEISEVDLNPVIARNDRIDVVDARIILGGERVTDEACS